MTIKELVHSWQVVGTMVGRRFEIQVLASLQGKSLVIKKKVEKYFLQTLCAERVLVLFDFKT